MAKILISPGKYVQGAGELKKLGEAYAKAAAEFLGLEAKEDLSDLFKELGKAVYGVISTKKDLLRKLIK